MNPSFGSHHSFIKLAYVITALVLLCGGPSSPVSCYMIPRVRVWVHNNIAPDTDMTIHCKSKDDDLGEQNTPYLLKETLLGSSTTDGTRIHSSGAELGTGMLKQKNL
ncbi:hypothetical protein C5167_021239 [Papaver somniferum]|uniref:S-protein homolog n=1 Tax=Papaver somniferum TaxID=3469 RepID=A0A4Y7IXD6_PAPSO|nr:hypothetical protein C5167_021239 [Papaver somniferum]